MARLIIDATKLAEWQGKLTGVPRVMNELSSRFGAEEGVLMVVWDAVGGQFRPTSYDAIMEQRSRREQVQPTVAAPTAPAWTLRRVVRGVERRVPGAERIRRRVQRAVRYSAPATPSVTGSGFAFEEDDVLVVLWGGWHDEIYIGALQSLCKQGVHLVEFVYDMLPVVTPQFSGHSTAALDHYASVLYPQCAMLLAISENSKKDAAEWLKERGLRVPPIRVIRLGEDFIIAKPTRPKDECFREAKLKGDDYLLCVGTIEARKNHTLLYYVYKLARQRGITLPKLVVVGRRGWLTDDIFTLITTDPDTKDAFVLLQSASDEELSWLYQHCLFSVYPSFYEGWGLPIAESIAHGVPCVASNTSSMPEIARGLITYFSPVSTDECLEALGSLLLGDGLQAARRKLGQYKTTSWDKTFTQVMQNIREL